MGTEKQKDHADPTGDWKKGTEGTNMARQGMHSKFGGEKVGQMTDDEV